MVEGMRVRRGQHGTFLIEMLAAFAILCGVTIVIITALVRTAEVSGLSAERATAALRLSETLDGVRAGEVETVLGGEVKRPPAPGEAKPAMECTVRAENWADAPALARVTVTVRWKSASGRDGSISAQTLVRKTRLRTAGGAR
jgi:hypothetical protein